MEYVNCDLCGKDSSIHLFQGKNCELGRDEQYSVVRCTNCGLVYLNPRPSEAEIARYYGEEYKPFQEIAGILGMIERIVVRVRTERLKKWVKKGGRILELGCGTGYYLASIRDTNLWEVAGVELSPYAANFARGKLGLPVSTGTIFDAAFPDEIFDAVIMRHVLEHVPNPSATMQEIYRVIKRDGRLILTVPNIETIEIKFFKASWHGWSLPTHFYLFSPETLSELLKKTGFVVEKLDYSALPNNWAGSMNNFLRGRKIPLSKFWDSNLVFIAMLFLFTPVSFLASKFKKSGRMDIIARLQ